ncbi:hypothetical protein [Novosphingobium kaempferiae]|uniref:hypothetical protein n=1 Tax=Novosphingobium kaempferiae TaxID=2896849 RepID=UPI001E5EBD7F|nr:hypothetical protein [Novosphingobium kaempferiae]
MISNAHKKLEDLEHAVLELEGAHYALHDMIAFALARTPQDEVEHMAASLADNVCVHAEKIGEIRLSAYLDEVKSVTEEVRQVRSLTPGLFARLTRSRAS